MKQAGVQVGLLLGWRKVVAFLATQNVLSFSLAWTSFSLKPDFVSIPHISVLTTTVFKLIFPLFKEDLG